MVTFYGDAPRISITNVEAIIPGYDIAGDTWIELFSPSTVCEYQGENRPSLRSLRCDSFISEPSGAVELDSECNIVATSSFEGLAKIS